MSENNETDFIGKTWFIGDKGIVEPSNLNAQGKFVIVNFPGSGMSCTSEDKNITVQDVDKAKETNNDIKKLISNGNRFETDDCLFFTAFYQNKADKVIKQYNSEKGRSDSSDTLAILDRLVSPMINENYDVTLENLKKLIFRGHCFGAVVISELEALLEKKLREKYTPKQCETLLSAPKAFLSSPALQTDKYPKHFKTTVIVNNSDRTLINENYCGNKLKESLRRIAEFEKRDLINWDDVDFNGIAHGTASLPKWPNLKGSVYKKLGNNVDLVICNRISYPDMPELDTLIKKRLEAKHKNLEDKNAYKAQLKKMLGGHEFYFLPDEMKNYLANSIRAAIRMTRAYDKIKNKELSNKFYKEKSSNLEALRRQDTIEKPPYKLKQITMKNLLGVKNALICGQENGGK